MDSRDTAAVLTPLRKNFDELSIVEAIEINSISAKDGVDSTFGKGNVFLPTFADDKETPMQYDTRGRRNVAYDVNQ